MCRLLLLSLFAASACALPAPDFSVVGSVFQWFETAVEMMFNYFMQPSSKPAGGERSAGHPVSYKDFQLVRAKPTAAAHVEELQALMGEGGLEFWSAPAKNRSTDILVAPELGEYLQEYLSDRDIEFSVLSSDLQAEIERQRPKRSDIAEDKADRPHPLTWTSYHSANEIGTYLDYLAESAPGLVSLHTIGKSSEGRPLRVAKVSSQARGKPAVWIDAGMHGREWIAPAVALFVLKQLVENYPTNKALVEAVDWYVLPLANPDGYEYSQTTDRFWRKTRSKPEPKNRMFWDDEDDCPGGVDLNRNFDFHWGEAGASDNPCGPTFAGRRPFSEPESKAIADFLLDKPNVRAYLSLHSYSQMWLVPWGYTRKAADDRDDLMELGKRAVEALKRVHGTEYQLGTSPQLLYPTSGSSDDWAKGRAGIKYSYTVELRDKGTYGFLLPATEILPTGRETFAAIKTVAKHIAKQAAAKN